MQGLNKWLCLTSKAVVLFALLLTQQVRADIIITVNSAGNEIDANEELTLIEAIDYVNENLIRSDLSAAEKAFIVGERDENYLIKFNIPGDGPHVIEIPEEGIPYIMADNVTIDGYTQPGSSPNTNSILEPNNAVIKLVIDAGEMGHANGEQDLLTMKGNNIHVRGFSFLSSFNAEIFGVNFRGQSNGGSLNGCWIGLHPDGETIAGGEIGVGVCCGTGGGHVIGTNGDGKNDRSEFNIIVGNNVNIIVEESPNVRFSGNFIGVMPDGLSTIPEEANELLREGDAVEGGEFDGMIVGTNGDGVADEDERNIIGGMKQDVFQSWEWTDGQHLVFAGNYVGVGIDGTTPLPNERGIRLNKATMRVGSNFDDVSDDIEANILANHTGELFKYGKDAVMYEIRGNSMFNNTGEMYSGLEHSLHARKHGDTADLAPVLVEGTSSSKLIGEVSIPGEVDLYLADPETALDYPQGKIYLGSFSADNNAFEFDLSGLDIPGNGVAYFVASSYIKDDDGFGTSPFSEAWEINLTGGGGEPSPGMVIITVNSAGNEIDANEELTLIEAIDYVNENLIRSDLSAAEKAFIVGERDENYLIKFNIPGDGPHVIEIPEEGIPYIMADNVTIDGYTQPGSSPNTNSILEPNNAVIKLVIDAGEMGHANGEQDLLTMKGNNIHVRGFSFLSSFNAEIFGVNFRGQSNGGSLNGCWIGLHPDGETIAGGEIGVGVCCGTGGGHVIGTNGDGKNDRSEFNIIVGNNVNIIVEESPNVRFSGNFIGVMPDGLSTIPEEANELLREGDAVEGGEFDGMIVGTNGDGVADEDERNIIGGMKQDVFQSWEWTDGQHLVFAGNYVGVGIDGTTPLPNERGIRLNKATMRVGSNFDDVSDDIEANILANHTGELFKYGKDAVMYEIRGNSMFNNTGEMYSGLEHSLHARKHGDTADLAPVLVEGTSSSKLIGEVSIPGEVDLYLADPETALDYPQGKIYLGSFSADNNAFEFDLSGLDIPGNGVAYFVASSYIKDDDGFGTSPFSEAWEINLTGGGGEPSPGMDVNTVAVLNLTKETVIFSDDFESSVIGEATASDDPQVGSWEWNGTPMNEVMGKEEPKGMVAAEGEQYLKVARMPHRVNLTAVGDLDAAADSEVDDKVEIRFSVFYESGYASIYPRSAEGDSAQITFFPNGEVRIYGGVDVGWQILEQTYNESEWNQVVIEYVNGSGEYSISVNGADFETYEGVSSEDNGSGGNVEGFRLQGDGDGTVFFVDAMKLANATKNTVMFEDDFESRALGETPGGDDPKVGNWEWNGASIAEVMGEEESEGMVAAEGEKYLKVARMPGRVNITAIGDFDAAADSEDGDTIEIRFSLFYESGYASVYPRSETGDSAQITFFPSGEVRIYGGGDVGWQILDQTYNEGEWNQVIIQYINGSGEYSISVNGAEFETYPSVSSADNGSGGNVQGFRLQGDGDATVFYLDGAADSGEIKPTISLVYNGDGTATLIFDGKLQSAPTVNGPWSDVNESSPVTLQLDQPAMFGRAVSE